MKLDLSNADVLIGAQEIPEDADDLVVMTEHLIPAPAPSQVGSDESDSPSELF